MVLFNVTLLSTVIMICHAYQYAWLSIASFPGLSGLGMRGETIHENINDCMNYAFYNAYKITNSYTQIKELRLRQCTIMIVS